LGSAGRDGDGDGDGDDDGNGNGNGNRNEVGNLEGVVLSPAPYRASSLESMKSGRQDGVYFPLKVKITWSNTSSGIHSIPEGDTKNQLTTSKPSENKNKNKNKNLEGKVMGNAGKPNINININIQHPTFTKINKQGRLALAEGGSSSRNIRPKTGQG
jgi:hypothetical protein